MELKRYIVISVKFVVKVLIVPSGIETLLFLSFPMISTVLIVPSGIETFFVDHPSTFSEVLIVPSGIETFDQRKRHVCPHRINCT